MHGGQPDGSQIDPRPVAERFMGKPVVGVTLDADINLGGTGAGAQFPAA
jgi:hypothetical protein